MILVVWLWCAEFLGGNKLTVAMEEWDEDRHMFTADVQGDERFSSCKVTMRFFPGPSPGTTTGTWIAHYMPNYERVTSPENMWFITSPCLMAIAVYVNAHSWSLSLSLCLSALILHLQLHIFNVLWWPIDDKGEEYEDEELNHSIICTYVYVLEVFLIFVVLCSWSQLTSSSGSCFLSSHVNFINYEWMSATLCPYFTLQTTSLVLWRCSSKKKKNHSIMCKCIHLCLQGLPCQIIVFYM